MKERPILFSGPMVRAILDGKKTQTRRFNNPPRWALDDKFKLMSSEQNDPFPDKLCAAARDGNYYPIECRYGQVGDRLWVRETFGYGRQCDDINEKERIICYKACYPYHITDAGVDKLKIIKSGAYMQPNHYVYGPDRWMPSIHMPRWASGIDLEITNIKIERLQDISEEDARAEGITDGGCINCGESEPCNCHFPMPNARDAFIYLWESINGKGSWNQNPWVWVVEFKVIK